MLSPFSYSPVIHEWLWKKTQIKKIIFAKNFKVLAFSIYILFTSKKEKTETELCWYLVPAIWLWLEDLPAKVENTRNFIKDNLFETADGDDNGC